MQGAYFKVVGLVLVILLQFLLKHRERVPDEEVGYVLSQQLVDPYDTRSDDWFQNGHRVVNEVQR